MVGLNRRSRYPIEEIIRDYERGYSFPMLYEKYGISRASAWRIVRKAGKTRDKSESRLFQSKGWRKLIHVRLRGKKYPTRLVSIPFKFLTQLGFKKDADLMAKWKIANNHLELIIGKNKGWRNLTRLGSRGKKYSTRIVSIPFKLLKELGFKKDDDLVAKWEISDEHLELFIRKK